MAIKNKVIPICAFFTLLDDRLGESFIFPLLPFLLERFTSSGTTLALLSGSYALAQFSVSPLIGALSDRYGRKPILKVCIAGSLIAISLFGITLSLNWESVLPLWATTVPLILLFIARIIDGLSGGTAATATAILADISTPENRAKTFGLIGLAFGLGFAIGPPLGGRLAEINPTFAVIPAAIFAIINLGLVTWILPETLPLTERSLLPKKRNLNPFSQLAKLFANQSVRRPCLGFFLFFMAFNGFTTVLVLYLKESFAWTSSLAGWVFAMVGIIAMIVQGGLIGPLVKKFGELQLTIIGLGLLTTGCLLIPMANQSTSRPVVFFGSALLAAGTGLVTPCLRGLISRRIKTSNQGTVLGGLQGLQSLGTFLGGTAAGFAYDQIGQKSPFFGGALILVLVITLLSRINLKSKGDILV
ncbi:MULTISPECIES: MFS transporter [Prochlorococcus]|uniref:MFS transporter n=1 Tax=Prochlorococcus TaxID=1218 RepID=UPI000533AE88|nr:MULTISPECIES: MFS transporter [Prochlorococcus]KGG13731.1 Multidrug efflux transporter [Prochlorococcus sp. MIT 0601]